MTQNDFEKWLEENKTPRGEFLDDWNRGWELGFDSALSAITEKLFQVFSERELAELLAEFAEDFQNEINHTRYGFKELALRFLKEKEGKK